MVVMRMSYRLLTPFALLLSILLPHIQCSADFFISHAPKYVNFLSKAGDISSDDIPGVLAAALGLPPKQGVSWSGLAEGDVFHRPKANVLFSIPGFNKDTHLDMKHHRRYPLKQEGPVDSESLIDRVQATFYDQSPLVIELSMDHMVSDLQSQYPKMFNKLPATSADLSAILRSSESIALREDIGVLNISNVADALLLGEIQVIQQIIDAVKGSESIKDSTPDILHFSLQGYKAVVREHGEHSTQARDALTLLQTFLEKMSDELRAIYNDHVLVEVVTLVKDQPTLSRKTRNILQVQPDKKPAANLADNYDDNYPVIFNIILWTMVAMALALFAISYGMWNMDPGRDSIIYRMTSMRVKKE